MRRGALAELVPEGVRVVESHELAPDSLAVHPLEAESITHAHRKRRLEFTAGRACAREALRRLGLPRSPIPVGPDREPIWPHGVVGSITHCPGYCSAAVARRSQHHGLGIDAERNAPLPDGVSGRICLPAEIAVLPDDAGVSWPAVLFSARESIFKAWYPLARRWLDYHDVEVTLDLPRQRFRVRPLHRDLRRSATALADVQGRFTWSGAHVFTGAWISP